MATTLRHSSGHQPNAQLLSTAWSPGGLQLASADRSGTIVVWS
jgi:WD40 repeat protein